MPTASLHIFGRPLLLLALFFGSLLPAMAQVGIGTTTPHAKAELEVSSTNKGLLPPRMTQAARDAIAPGADAAGLTIYNTSTGKLNTWNGTRWTETLTTTEQTGGLPITFAYTGGPQTYVVPAGVTRIQVTAAGGGGGDYPYGSGPGYPGMPGGVGAQVSATLAVTPGETLTVRVGGRGTATTATGASVGGYNGGGEAARLGGGGGGATDLRRATATADAVGLNRLLVAGGGGGGGYNVTAGESVGGAGGTPTGETGQGGFRDPTGGGEGGTQSGPGGNATANVGGDNQNPGSGGGAGGGGYYGGGGSRSNGGGGGGASWVVPTGSSNLSYSLAGALADGSLTLTPVVYAAPVLDGSNFVNVPGTFPQLTLSGQTLGLSTGGSVTLPTGADNLGNHTATTNVGLNGNWLSNAPGNANGLRIDNSGNVGVGLAPVGAGLHVRTAEKPSVSSSTGVFLSGGASGNPSIELRGLNGSAYLDFVNDLTSDYASRILSNGSGLGLYAGSSVNPYLLVTPSGLVRISSLANAGNRMVTTDNSGNLLTATLPTDAQNLTLTGAILTISGGNSVTLPDASNTNEIQTLALNNQTLSLSGSNSVTLPSGADNLGNHTATQALNLGANQLVGNGGTSGLAISSVGGVGIGGAAPASAALAVTSTTKGFLPPRLSRTERDLIASPAPGLVIYNLTTNKLNTWNGTSWDESVSINQQSVQYPIATFNYTGAVQTYTVPDGVTRVTVTANGAQGGSYFNLSGTGTTVLGGQGARVQTTLTVVPGEVLHVYVGGSGTASLGSGAPGGFNGGGAIPGSLYGASGGGGTELDRGASTLLAAGGGGGAAYAFYGEGGGGGAPDGLSANPIGGAPGQGGTQTAGGSYGGSIRQGGPNASNYSGAGGGGYYGGGGGGDSNPAHASGGGGGSSWVTATGATNTSLTANVNSGNGSLIITPAAVTAAPVLDGTNFVNVPGDNLGNHTATQALDLGTFSLTGTTSVNVGKNLNLGTNLLVGNGGTSGVAISSAGNVGIGTAPTSNRLDVSGNAAVSGTETIGGNAYVNGGLGVVLNGQDRPLITRGYDPFTSGSYTGAGRWGVFMESSTLTFGVPAIANRNFQWATYNAASTVNTRLMTLTQSARLGVGVSDPAQTLDVNGGVLARGFDAISNQGAYLQWNRSLGEGETWLLNQKGGGNLYAGIRFGSASATNVVTEWARFIDNGNLGLGTVTPDAKLDIESSAQQQLILTSTSTDPTGVIQLNFPATNSVNVTASELITFNKAGVGMIGAIGANLSNNTIYYNTASDRRLKEHIRPTHYGLKDLLKIEVKDYNFIGTAAANRTTGFLAQDLFAIYPEAVKPGDTGATVTNAWAVDYGKLTPLLVQAIQDQQQLIDAQRAEIEALKAQNTAQQAQTTATLESLADRLRALEAGQGQARK